MNYISLWGNRLQNPFWSPPPVGESRATLLGKCYHIRFYEYSLCCYLTSHREEIQRWSEFVLDRVNGSSGNESGNSSRNMVLGFSTRWKRPKTRHNPIIPSTLQLCYGNICIIIQGHVLFNLPDSLRQVLDSPLINFVGIDSTYHKYLLRTYYGLDIRNAIELSSLAAPYLNVKREETKRWEIGTFVKVFFNKEYEPSPEMYSLDWEGVLLEKQVNVAALGAFFAWRMGLICKPITA
ncbi:Werner Syndrome-like exonuclease-like [Quillaja saponaria]|uniref:Werner Syndrome-like exonuclease-like n=1 Tax=Quillaja saponaria TaxID=32244 RepID=A0AAD7VIA2_QUISA|nr:Werner Syndrome-like exonuclease-like [Quillaja saponaria]